MTRSDFNRIAKARFEALLGITLECSMTTAKEGIFVTLIAEGNRSKELATLPNLDGEVDYDEGLNETFAYVKLS
jgi:hypothetical protein